MIKTSIKKSETTMRISKLLLEFINRPMNYEEMFKYLEEKVKSPVYTTEVLNKYLNTLRALGLQIEKYNGKYYLLNFLTQIELNHAEADAFNSIEKSVLKYGTDSNIRTFIDIKQKILKFIDNESQKRINHYVNQSFTTEIGLKIKQFEKICDDAQKIKIEYNGELMVVEPKKVIFDENRIYLECNNSINFKLKKLLLEKINLISRQPTKNTNINMPNAVVYELSGKLSKTYKLKENEILLAQSDDKLFIKCENEDYEFLARRLIRYQNFCKIIKPIEFRDYFVDFLDKIISLYEDKL